MSKYWNRETKIWENEKDTPYLKYEKNASKKKSK